MSALYQKWVLNSIQLTGKTAVLIVFQLVTMKIIVLFMFILSGCATFTGYNSMVESYHGIPEAELIRTWGIPSKIHESYVRPDGGKSYLRNYV
jgi:hypothetical protein